MSDSMKKLARILLLLCLLCLISLPSGAQAPARAVLTGVVVRAGTGEPIPRAQVTITRVAAPTPAAPAGRNAGQRGAAVQTPQPAGVPSVTADANGRFGITDVEPASYRIQAARNGFM